MAGIKQIIGGLGLVILFSIAALFFMIEMIQINNPDSLVNNDPYISSTINTLNETTQIFKTTGENAQETLASDKPSSTFVFLIIRSAFDIPFSFLSFTVLGLGQIITVFFTLLFGQGQNQFYIVFGVINTILLITIVIAIIKAVRTGEVDR